MIKDYQKFKDNVNTVIQNSGLDIGAVYYILKDTYRDIEQMYFLQVNKEILSEQEKQNNEEFEEVGE